MAYAPNQIDTHVEFRNQSEAHACSTIAWDPTVQIALNAVFQQSRWRMSQYAGENRLHPRVAAFMLSWEGGAFSSRAAGTVEKQIVSHEYKDTKHHQAS